MLRLAALFLTLWCALAANFAYAEVNFAERSDVKAFIDKMVTKHDFNKQHLIALFGRVKLRPQVIRHINKPLEREPWHTYQMLFVNEWRIKHGVEFWNKYADTLRRAEETFGVPAGIIVATIGIETKYGQNKGGYRVMDSLSNLGFSDSPRAAFFRKELEEFLLLTREEHLDPFAIMGSYAGAIGQPQFMPSSYRYYAVNFSKSGTTDLMNNEVDVIGSIANYYKKHGWKNNQPVVMEAFMNGNRYQYLKQHDKLPQAMTFAELAKYGIVPKHGIKENQLKVKVIELDDRYKKQYWLGFHNFYVIKRYNPSDLYAMAVYELSNYITALRKRLNNG